MSAIESTAERVNGAWKGSPFEPMSSVDGILCLRCPLEDALELLGSLRSAGQFEICTLVTALDHDGSPVKNPARFEIVWQLQSVEHKDRVRVHAWLAGSEPGQEGFTAPSVCGLWPSAAYPERECFDMFGIQFAGHEGLKRILMPEAYEYHPLRKEFPHGGIEPDRLYNAWDKERRQGADVASSGGPR